MFREATECSAMRDNQRSWGTYRFNQQDWRVGRARNQQDPSSACSLLHAGSVFVLHFNSEDEAIYSSETSLDFQRTTRRCENPKSYKFLIYLKINMLEVRKVKSYPSNRPWRPIRLWDVEAPTFSLDSRLTDGGEVVSLMRRSPFTRHGDSWYSFLLEAELTPGP
jgi:hypothetical protein